MLYFSTHDQLTLFVTWCRSGLLEPSVRGEVGSSLRAAPAQRVVLLRNSGWCRWDDGSSERTVYGAMSVVAAESTGTAWRNVESNGPSTMRARIAGGIVKMWHRYYIIPVSLYGFHGTNRRRRQSCLPSC